MPKSTEKEANMLKKLGHFDLESYPLMIASASLVIVLSGCEAIDFTPVSFGYPVYQTGQTEAQAITLNMTVIDNRQNRSLDHLVKTGVVLQVKEQIRQDLQSAGPFVVTEGSQAKYSMQVKIEQLNYDVPGYATRTAINGLLSNATMNLSAFFTQGAGIDIIGYARLEAIVRQDGERVVWSDTFSGQHTETASMQTAKSHAVEGSAISFALREAIAKLKTRLLQLPA
jgi:hypothetical protein